VIEDMRIETVKPPKKEGEEVAKVVEWTTSKEVYLCAEKELWNSGISS
jgi:hypothetical protein